MRVAGREQPPWSLGQLVALELREELSWQVWQGTQQRPGGHMAITLTRTAKEGRSLCVAERWLLEVASGGHSVQSLDEEIYRVSEAQGQGKLGGSLKAGPLKRAGGGRFWLFTPCHGLMFMKLQQECVTGKGPHVRAGAPYWPEVKFRGQAQERLLCQTPGHLPFHPLPAHPGWTKMAPSNLVHSLGLQ